MDTGEAKAVMESHGWLSCRPKVFRDELMRCSQLKLFKAGEILYNAGEAISGKLSVISGQLMLRLQPADTGPLADTRGDTRRYILQPLS